MFESLIQKLIDALLDEYGPLFKGAYKKIIDDKVGIDSDVAYQFYIAENDKTGNFNVAPPTQKNYPTTVTKDYKLVIQFTNRINKELLITKSIKILTKYASSIRYNEESKIIQDLETKQKGKLEIPLMMFTFTITKLIMPNNCGGDITELSC